MATNLTPDVLQWLAANPRGGAFNGYFYSPQGGYDVGNADIGITTAPVTGWNRTVLPPGARSIGTTPQGVTAYDLPEDAQHEAFGLDGGYTHNWTGKRGNSLLKDLAIFAAMATGVGAAGAALTAGAAAGAGGAAAGAAGAGSGSVAPLSMADITAALAPTNASLAAGGAGLEAGAAALASGGIATGGAGAAEGLVGSAGQEAAATGIDSASRAVLNSATGYGPGMTGAQTGLIDTLSPWIGPEAAASVANSGAGDMIGRVISGLGSGAGNMLSSLVQSVGPAIAMKVLAGEVAPPTADPALAAAIQGQLDLAKSAEARATANDDYWKANFAPRLLANMDSATALSKQLQDFNLGLAKKYDDRYWNTTARFQDQFYKDVDRYNTDEERERIAGEAIGDVRRGFSTARAIAGRDLARMGINPGSGRYAGQLKQLALDEALAGAAAGTQSRRAAEDKGLQLKLTAAGMNTNLPGATGAAAAGAGNASSIASQGIGTAANAWGSNNAGYNNTMQIAQGAYGALGGLGMGLTNNAWNTNLMNTNQRNQIIGAGLGMLNFGR